MGEYMVRDPNLGLRPGTPEEAAANGWEGWETCTAAELHKWSAESAARWNGDAIKTGPLDEQSRRDIKAQTGADIKDWGDYRKYLKDHNLGREEKGSPQAEHTKAMREWARSGGSASGAPMPRMDRPSRKNPIDIKEIYRETKERMKYEGSR